MTTLSIEVTEVDPPTHVILSSLEREFATVITQDLPGDFEWLPQTVKFKVTTADDDFFLYRANFLFKRKNVGHSLVIVIMEPLTISYGNIFKLDLLQQACRSVHIDFMLLVYQAKQRDKDVLSCLGSCKINHTLIDHPKAVLDIVNQRLSNKSEHIGA